ncbi:Kelch domain-containing protein 10 homolog [Eumeta japonica]|uniref:Kelch domain-containing protein 10 homolog n=1 Tax=Eumeta variegata TaxID=151549 RepID=A0A4C1TM51_EUMVA|nr:Kelch domain-containing protein 10 homolog [Eumeta japonica]
MVSAQRNLSYVFEPYKAIKVPYLDTQRPRPRSGHRIACDDANIYCFGGYNPGLPIDTASNTWSPDRPLFRDLWCFNIAERTWKPLRILGDMRDELASCAMCMNGNYLMIYGGTGSPFGSKCSNDVTIWHVPKGECHDAHLKLLTTKGQRPPGQYGQSVLCHKGYFYTIGGTNGFDYNCDIHRLNLKTLTWECVFIGTGQEGEPIGRYRHELAVLNEKLYVIGGGTGAWAFELMEMPVFDLKTKTWSMETPKGDDSFKGPICPMPRKCHSAVQIDTPNGAQVFVVGGTDGNLAFQDIWRLQLPEMQWTIMRKCVLPKPIYFHSATVTSSGCMYIFGGIESDELEGVRTNNLYKIWLSIPKLSEICWEAVVHYNPVLARYGKTRLAEAGIPLRFVQRLQTA